VTARDATGVLADVTRRRSELEIVRGGNGAKRIETIPRAPLGRVRIRTPPIA
jgi:hypothetical protein